MKTVGWLAPLALAVAVLALHWPGGAGFKSDDYPAIRYAQYLGNCLQDFVGPQYGIGFFLFYRPLITLSFGLDYWLFGAEPFGFYLMNTLALVASALLLHAILRRLRPDPVGAVFAFVVVALWVCHPILVPSHRWVAGRVDAHVVPLILLALWLHLELRRGGRRWPVWVAAAAALCTKESAIGFPLLALGLDFLDPHPSYRRAPGLFGRGLPALPYLALIPAFLLLRLVLLGKMVGGYGFLQGRHLDLGNLAEGATLAIAEVLKPGLSGFASKMPALLVVAAVAFWVFEGRGSRRARVAGALLVAGGLFGPLAQVLVSIRGDQRHAYLACTCVLAVWAGLATRLARGLWPAGLALGLVPLVWLLPARAEARARMDVHDRFNASLVAAIADCDGRLRPGEPVVLDGDGAAAFHPYRFLWGLDSVHKPPFAERARDVVLLRKVHDQCTPAVGPRVIQGLASYVVVAEKGTGAASAPRAPPQPVAERAEFTGTLEPADIDRMARAEAFGFRVGDGFDGKVTIGSTVGACVVTVAPRDGVLCMNDVFLADVTRGGGLPVCLVFWNALDLAEDSPLFLFWREGRGVVRASFRASRPFIDAFREALEETAQ